MAHGDITLFPEAAGLNRPIEKIQNFKHNHKTKPTKETFS